MLPLILKQCATSEQVDTVCTQVGKYVAEAFPISSKDLVQGTALNLDYMAQLDQVLKCNLFQLVLSTILYFRQRYFPE